MDIYQENILDHYKHPRNGTPLSSYDLKEQGANPSCGDDIVLYVKMDGERIADIGYLPQGCAISTAAMSMLSEKVKGMTRVDAKTLTADDVYALLGVSIGPEREKCALLGLQTLQKLLQ